MKLFDNRPWFQGNLHTHTTLSDGRKSVEESARMYKEAGYDFIAVTDHRKVFWGGEAQGLTLLSGIEMHENDFDDRTCYHITGLGIKQDIQTDNDDSPADLVTKLRAAGAEFVTVAHPGWSLMHPSVIEALPEFDAIEIYNGVSDVYSGRGYYEDYADLFASKGKVKKITAVDDTHFYMKDFARGFVRVQADECSERAILDALKAGRYYSSQGPEIKQITVENDHIVVETSAVAQIRFYTDTFYSRDRMRYAKPETVLEQATYYFTPTDRVVRVEAVDFDGKKCWSNFIPVPEK